MNGCRDEAKGSPVFPVARPALKAAAVSRRIAAERLGKACCERGAEQRAGGTAGGDKPEQALALLGVVDVGHERPEHGDRKQIEHTDPHEKCLGGGAQFDPLRQKQPEDDYVDGEEVIHQRDEALARHAGHQSAVNRHHGEHDVKRFCEKIRQIFDAAGQPHLVADRAQHIVGGEQAKEIGERQGQCAALAGPYRHQAR